MPASLSNILGSARAIKSFSPGLGMGHVLSPTTRDRLEGLALDCGLTSELASAAEDADLISIYLVAIKDPRGAERVAQRITARMDPLAGTPGTGKIETPDEMYARVKDEMFYKQTSRVTPNPPTAPVPAPKVDIDAIRRMIKEEVEKGVLNPLQVKLGNIEKDILAEARMAQDTADAAMDLAKAGSVEEALKTMREAMVVEAQAAAAIALKDLRPTLLDIIRDPLAPEPVPLGLVHKDTPKIINALNAGVNVYLHGPAGSGKTTVGHKCAEAFGLKFYFAAKVESEYQLMGFKDAKGDTVRTQFREAYEHGGVFLFDEMDASSPSAVVALNAALANGMCPFPDGIVKRHADFRCLGAGNTKLTGANRMYAGRNQLDAASIDRFAFIEFNYDDTLELALATDHAWAKYVQSVRRAVAERGLNHLVTPRATYDGCKLLAAGFEWDTVASMCVYKGLDADTVKQIQQAL